MLTQILQFYAALNADRRAVTAMEYAVVAGVIVTVIVAGFTAFGNSLSTALAAIAAKIPQ